MVILSVEEQVGVQEAAVKEPLAPDGKPETEKVTGAAVPEVSVEVTVFEVELPAVTDWEPAVATENTNGGVVTTVEVTLSVNVEVLTTDPLVPVTVIG